jgi:hypothetical protein
LRPIWSPCWPVPGIGNPFCNIDLKSAALKSNCAQDNYETPPESPGIEVSLVSNFAPGANFSCFFPVECSVEIFIYVKS